MCAMNDAGGYLIPPAMIFPRKRVIKGLMNGAPQQSVCFVSQSGWTDSDIFLKWLEHFARVTNASTNAPQIIILDSHHSHKSLAAITFARRRLAGHLFQDRWKDQGRGFILLPPWPPNFLGQMLTIRDFSQHLVSSSKTIKPNIPRGARCMRHCEMM